MTNLRIPQLRDNWTYKLLGPTTVHLKHEFYLLVALVLLTISSSQALYRGSFGSWGDCKFLFFATLWLARHLILRWLCAMDIATSRSPTISGLLVFWLTSHITAGQYFDRPNSQVVAKQTGTSHTDDGRIVATISSFFSPSILYLWQLLRVQVWFPILGLQEHLWSCLRGRGAYSAKYAAVGRKARSPKTSLGINQAYSYWSEFWNLYGIPLQAIISCITVVLYAWYLFGDMGTTEVTYALTMNTKNVEDDADRRPYGAYQKLEKPTLSQMLVILSVGGTLATIVLYGRLVLPLPDLVAGSNVLKAVRNEAKTNAIQSSKSTKSKAQREVSEIPWAEQYKSIVGENRFRLICKIALLRLLESVFICAVLPRTGFACRFTGHCPEGLSLKELSKVFFPVGITSPLRSDTFYKTESAYVSSDPGATLMTIGSVIIISVSIFFAQAATSNRSYLGIMGYIAGGWSVVDSSDPALFGVTPSQWDPRRRYKKGDLIVQSYPGFGSPTVYMATSNSPEGRPLDLYLRATHDLFRNELGHPATSNIIAFSSAAQLGMSILTVLMILCYQAMDYGYGSLLWTLAANLIATYGILSTAMPNCSEFAGLAQQIAGDL